ncbi:MAG: ferritin-like domain-containing protein [Actinomycetota bacterium]|nr:ferritin-like domain-containing protein [Actinomycetota bacterium]
MSEAVSLELVDAGSAFDNAPDGGLSTTRSELFKKAAIGGGTFVAGGVLFAGLPQVALGAKSAKQDVQILNFALTLEYLESEFYIRAVKSGNLSGEVLGFAKTVRDHEIAHVKFLKSVLKNAAIDKPRFDFKNSFRNEETFMAVAIVLEETGVAAYNGQGARLTRATLGPAGTIVSVEARHAAWARRIMFGPRFRGGRDTMPAPVAFDAMASMKQVLRAVGKTGFIKG